MNKPVTRLLLFIFAALLLTATALHPPKLFVIGDSISMQYGPYLREALGDSYHYDRKRGNGQAWEDLDRPIGANGGDSRMVLNYLRSLAADTSDFTTDLLLINAGLHDIKTRPATGERQVEPAEYESNLREIVRISREQAWPLVFMTTTVVVDSIHNGPRSGFHRHAADVELYNGIASRVMREHYVPIVDLYTFSATFPEASFRDHVHYHEAYRRRQADFIAGHLLAWRERFAH